MSEAWSPPASPPIALVDRACRHLILLVLLLCPPLLATQHIPHTPAAAAAVDSGVGVHAHVDHDPGTGQQLRLPLAAAGIAVSILAAAGCCGLPVVAVTAKWASAAVAGDVAMAIAVVHAGALGAGCGVRAGANGLDKLLHVTTEGWHAAGDAGHGME